MGAAEKIEGPAYDYTEPSNLMVMEIRDYWDWSSKGMCNKYPGFFHDPTKTAQAKFICSECPVAPDCLLWSLIYDEQDLWGGLTRQERVKMYPKKLRETFREKAVRSGQFYERLPISSFLQELKKRPAEPLAG